MNRFRIPHCHTLMALGLAAALTACSGNESADPHQTGANPQLPDKQAPLVPSMGIAKPTTWQEVVPTAPQGFKARAIATGLGIPRQILVLPNGDLLIAEGRGGHAPKMRPKDFIAGSLKAKGNTSVKSGNRLTLLRDVNGDGSFRQQTVFADNLDAPYGMALVGNTLYVANQGELVSFAYTPGQTKAAGKPRHVADLPSVINHHWTKSLAASPDGKFLYVGIGSNSNIMERGPMAEQDRATVWQIDVATGAHRQFVHGIRNPTALAVHPETGVVFAVVNERDELGPNLVPDYLTSLREGANYGWPYSYWGQNVDTRVHPQKPEVVATAIKPDYSLGSHVAALGLAFSNAAVGGPFTNGVFIGEHGSWNRDRPAGYKVVFVPFANGMPAGEPVDFATGFHDPKSGLTRGRPVGVAVDAKGAVYVADDLANTIWRISR